MADLATCPPHGIKSVTLSQHTLLRRFGGLIQNGSVTESRFLEMLRIILITGTQPIRVQHRASGDMVSMSDNSLQLGIYDISCHDMIRVSDEPWVQRIIKFNVSGREDRFREGIRARDGNSYLPLEKENLWIEWGFGQCITDMDDTTGLSKINSWQNGLLFSRSVHGEFNQYLLSVNPDVSCGVWYRYARVDGRTLDLVCRDPENPHRVSDELLRWHFRQCVFENMRGPGEPIFEHDFPPGTDMMREISEGPCANERFELELSTRFRVAA
ncbi:hypothetical protein DFP73DRAFT_578713 [Morchella snyderi]|nr:hypothetical protein DFP73DRAFT_578713 [Morchella snyderi]